MSGIGQEKLELWIRNWVAKATKTDVSQIRSSTAFWDCGLDSLAAVDLSAALEELTGREVSPAIAWEMPTIRDLAEYLASPVHANE
jgi:acyl carrier protein